MRLSVLWPFSSYDFGHGLPIIYDTGTEVTADEYAQIQARVLAIPNKSRPQFKVEDGPDINVPPPVVVPAFKHHQTSPAAEWTLVHNRNTKPDVVLIPDTDGDERVYTDVTYPDESTVLVEWPSPTTGWAYIG